MNNSKPNILMVADTYYPQVDGVLRFMEEFIKRARNNFEITLLVPGLHGKRIKDIKTVFLEVSKWIKMVTYPSIKISFSNLKKIKEEVKKTDIVFVQDLALEGYLAIKYAQKYHKKIIFYSHQLIWEQFEKTSHQILGKLLTGIVKHLSVNSLNRCDLLILPYPELKRELRESGIRTKIQIAKLGIDINRFLPVKNKDGSKAKLKIPGRIVIGYVGRISKEKNTLVLLEAFRKLDQEKVFLLIVGDGQPEIVEEFKECKNCRVTGFVDKVEDYLQAMDIFVMPSLVETTSLATLEAMSCGLPVIVTKIGFMKEYVIKDYNGMFFPRANPTLLAMKIEKLMEDNGFRGKLSLNARKTVAYSFSWERSINKIKRIFLKVYYKE